MGYPSRGSKVVGSRGGPFAGNVTAARGGPEAKTAARGSIRDTEKEKTRNFAPRLNSMPLVPERQGPRRAGMAGARKNIADQTNSY